MECRVHQIVYFSTASGRQDAIVTAEILAASRCRNRRDKIAGLLIAGGHRYLHVFEGPSDAVAALLDRLCRDDRHVGVTVLVDRRIEQRSFDGWSMAFNAEPQLDDFASLRDLVGEMRAHLHGPRLRAQLDCFAQTFATTPLETDAAPWKLARRYPAGLAVDRGH